jgi:maleamate amidohydrolase
VIAAILALLTLFRERKLPVFYTTVAYGSRHEARTFREKLPVLDMLTAGSKWVGIDSRIAPEPDEPVIVKHLPSGFFGTDLAQQLMASRADTVVVTGLTTSGCVRATAVDALAHGFYVLVPRQAVGDRDPLAHEANLHDIDRKYGDVVSVEEMIEMMAGFASRSAHEGPA